MTPQEKAKELIYTLWYFFIVFGCLFLLSFLAFKN
jgi:hypothetical protein